MNNPALKVKEDSLDLLGVKNDAMMDLYEPPVPPIFKVKTLEELMSFVENNDKSFELYKMRNIKGIYFPEVNTTPCDIIDNEGFIIDNTCHNIIQAIARVVELAEENHKTVRDYHIFNLLTLKFVDWERLG